MRMERMLRSDGSDGSTAKHVRGNCLDLSGIFADSSSIFLCLSCFFNFHHETRVREEYR